MTQKRRVRELAQPSKAIARPSAHSTARPSVPTRSRPVLTLQRVLGNRRVARLIQTKRLREETNRLIAPQAGGEHVLRTIARREIAGAGRVPAGRVQKFDSYEHVEIGDDATRGAHGEKKTVELAPDYRVSYGEMIALSGDYFGSISELRSIAAVPGKGAGTREEIDYVRRVQLPNIS